jgi:hypothetical protein
MAPPLPTPTGVVKLTMKMLLGGFGPYGDSFSMSYTGAAPTTAQLSSLATTVATEWNTNLAALARSADTLVEVIAVDLANPGTIEGTAIVSHAGTRAGTASTSGLCVSLAFSPNHRYRGSRPKAFLPFGVDTDLASLQHWSTTFLTAVQTGWAAFITGVVATNASGIALGVQVSVSYIGPPYTIHPNSGNTRAHAVGTPKTPPAVYTTLAVIAAPKVGSQRKRLGKPF